jgi:undecaprenyl-diphosphatase
MPLRTYLTSSPFISKRLVVIYLLFILGVTLFLSVYDGVKESADLASLDIPVKMWAQTHQYAPLTIMMRVVTDILSPAAVGAFTLIGATLWAWRKKEYWRPVVTVSAVSFAFIIAAIIKDYTARARPTVTDLLGGHAGISYSFPSGHTIGVATLVLILSYFAIMSRPTLRRASLWFALSAVSIILVAFSRIYLGYHWLTDVTASVGLAIIVLALVVSVDTYVRRHRARLLQKRL